MERQEFKTLVKGMKAVYTQPTFIPDQDAFNIWYELLKDLPYEQANIAIQKYVLTEKFPPTIADIRTKASEIISRVEESMSELEAWSLVNKAIRNSGYHAQEEFEKLPEACRIAVGNPSNLKEWAMMESDKVATVEQSHFIRNYRVAVQRMKEDAKIPGFLKIAIASMREKAEAIEQKQNKAIEVKAEPEEKRPEGVPMPPELAEKLRDMLGRAGKREDQNAGRTYGNINL